jgi:hypothetical protein
MIQSLLSPPSFILLFSWLMFLLSTTTTTTTAATIRQYYITAEEIDWDYAPQHWDNLRDQPLNQTYMADLYTARNATRLGTVYRKAIYQQYTDNSFTVPVAHDPALGFLGPVIKAEGKTNNEMKQKKNIYPLVCICIYSSIHYIYLYV